MKHEYENAPRGMVHVAHSSYFTSSWSSYRLYHEATLRTVAYVTLLRDAYASASEGRPGPYGVAGPSSTTVAERPLA